MHQDEPKLENIDNLTDLEEELAPPQGMVTLPQAEMMGLSFSSQPLLLQRCPFSPPHSSCRPSTQSSQSIKEAPGLAPHPLHTE